MTGGGRNGTLVALLSSILASAAVDPVARAWSIPALGLPKEMGDVAVNTGKSCFVLRFAVMGVPGCGAGVMGEKRGALGVSKTGRLEVSMDEVFGACGVGLGVSGAKSGRPEAGAGGCAAVGNVGWVGRGSPASVSAEIDMDFRG